MVWACVGLVVAKVIKILITSIFFTVFLMRDVHFIGIKIAGDAARRLLPKENVFMSSWREILYFTRTLLTVAP